MSGLSRLSAVPEGGLPQYELGSDVRLDSHSYVQFHFHRYFQSRLHMRGSLAVRGAANELFLRARLGSPIGTLTTDYEELADYLRITTGQFRDLMSETVTPLHNWTECQTDTGEVRLYHPVVLEVLRDALKSRVRADLRRKEDASRGRITTLIGLLKKAGMRAEAVEHIASSDGAFLEQIDEWLLEHYPAPMRRTPVRVQQAVAAVEQMRIEADSNRPD